MGAYERRDDGAGAVAIGVVVAVSVSGVVVVAIAIVVAVGIAIGVVVAVAVWVAAAVAVAVAVGISEGGDVSMMDQPRPDEYRLREELQQCQAENERLRQRLAELERERASNAADTAAAEIRAGRYRTALHKLRDRYHYFVIALATVRHERDELRDTDWHTVAEQNRRERDSARIRAEVAEESNGDLDRICDEMERERDEVRKRADEHLDGLNKLTARHGLLQSECERLQRERDEAIADRDYNLRLISMYEQKEAAAEARAERLAEAIQNADANLAEALPAALKLATDPAEMDWGEVSDYGCDVVHNVERARDALADAPEHRPCPKCERLAEALRRQVIKHATGFVNGIFDCTLCGSMWDSNDDPAVAMVRKSEWHENDCALADASKPAPCPECEQIRAKLNALADLWERQQRSYSPDRDGEVAAATVRCCVKELRAELAHDRPAEEETDG